MPYLSWKKITKSDATEAEVEAFYNDGFVATRLGRGVFDQTRSFRINLQNFSLSSENRRILKKTDGLSLEIFPLPLRTTSLTRVPEDKSLVFELQNKSETEAMQKHRRGRDEVLETKNELLDQGGVSEVVLKNYSWEIGKLGKDFYDTKFGPGTMSANKIKEILTDTSSSSFTHLFVYSFEGKVVGYCIALVTPNIVHYSYPFYSLDTSLESLGLGMMTRAIEWAKSSSKSHIYLGSLQRPGDTYKLQFGGGEWYTGDRWDSNTESVKEILKK